MNFPGNCVLLILFASSLSVGQTTLDKSIKLFDEGKYNESQALFRQVLKESPDNAVACYYLGMLVMDKDYDEAIDLIEKSVDADKTNAKYHLALGNAYGLKAQRAGILKKFGAASNCRKQYETAVQSDPKLTEARSNLIEYFLQAPGIMGGSDEKAMAQADTIASYDTYLGNLARARIHEYKKEFPEEEQNYLNAIYAEPKKPLAYEGLWAFYINQKNDAKANETLSKALKALEKAFDVYYWAGQYLVQTNDFVRAREYLQKAADMDPKNLSVYYQLGKVVLLSGNDLEKGLTYFEKYLQAEPPRNAPSWAHTHWRMGMIYEKLGKNNEARAEYQKSLELNPQLEEAKKALDALK